MSIDTEKLAPVAVTFTAACRENTGAALCDSGGAYGRWHEAPEIDSDAPVTKLEFCGWNEDGTPEVGKYGPRGDIMASLETGPFLDECVEIDRELQARFEEFAESREDPREPWENALEAFMEEAYPGWELATSGNTYNEDTDLTQCFTWWVFVNPEEVSDWLHADEGEFVSIYRIHTGCDVRGGYGRPIFSTENASNGGDGYPIPLDHVCEFFFQEIEGAVNETPPLPGMPEPINPGADFSERFNDAGYGSKGYSSYPVGEIMKYVKRCWPETARGGAVDVEVCYRSDGVYHVEPGDGSAGDITVRVRLYAERPYL